MHAIPLVVVSLAAGSDVSPFLNRYLVRAIDAEVVSRQNEVLVYTKLCRLLIIGHVVVAGQRRWRASRLCVDRGTFGGAVDYYLPSGLQQYMNQRAMLGPRHWRLSPPGKGPPLAAERQAVRHTGCDTASVKHSSLT